MYFYFIFILLTILINSSNSQFNWGTRSDHHTTGTILQANGGGVQRYMITNILINKFFNY